LAGGPIALVVTAGDPASRRTGATLFPGARLESLERRDLRPTVPFEGPLFELFAAQSRGACIGLVVLVRGVRTPVAGGGRPDVHDSAADVAGDAPAAGEVIPIVDHIGLDPCGPLTGRWPDAVPRGFPAMSGIYQPALVRPRAGPRVYSSGVVAAGVRDARRLTRFEARAAREGGCSIVSDSLVPAAIVAAYYGLKLAACGVAQAPPSDRE
jgi:hypothetical protein